MIFSLAVSPVVQAYVYNIIACLRIFSVVKSELTTNTPPVSSSTTAPVSTGVSEGAVKQLKEELDSLKN